ncbi:RidA family protein [Sphingobium sp. EP60837]|uniref:RidA family protein n=1 Tax=Sphingobium sp. EP60837 TaxID=1855519 RepID=UPI0007DDA1F1|nr:RidA family protein [Sphingobium sp. EP60837]ANI79259.1 2-aminomuconate deaminase [Sphingobium sp. EP60837]
MTSSNLQRELINPAGSEILYDNYHFSQGVKVGSSIWVSGQVGLNNNFQPADGIVAQTRIAFQSIESILKEAGATMADIVELTSFHIDLHGEIEAFSAVKDEYVARNYPAWTAVGVTQLAVPGLLVEIRAVAVLGSGKE